MRDPHEEAQRARGQTGEWVRYLGDLSSAQLEMLGVRTNAGLLVAVPSGSGDDAEDSDASSQLRAARGAERTVVTMVRASIVLALASGVYPADLEAGVTPRWLQGAGWIWRRPDGRRGGAHVYDQDPVSRQWRRRRALPAEILRTT